MQPPPPNVDLGVLIGERCIRLTWGLLNEKVRYWRVTNITAGVQMKTQNAACDFEGLRCDCKYSFRLCGVNERGQGPWSDTVHVHPDGSVDFEASEESTHDNSNHSALKDEQIATLQAEVERLQFELTAALELVVDEKHHTTADLERMVERLEADKSEKSRLLIQAAEVMKEHENHVQSLDDHNATLTMEKENLERQLFAKERRMEHLEAKASQWMEDWQQQKNEMERKIRREVQADLEAKAEEDTRRAAAEDARSAAHQQAEADRQARKEARERAEEERTSREKAQAVREEAAMAQAQAEAASQARREAKAARLRAMEEEKLRSLEEEESLLKAAERRAAQEARRQAEAESLRQEEEDARGAAREAEEREAAEEEGVRLVVERERARALSDAAKAKADREARQNEEAKRLLSRKSRVCGRASWLRF